MTLLEEEIKKRSNYSQRLNPLLKKGASVSVLGGNQKLMPLAVEGC